MKGWRMGSMIKRAMVCMLLVLVATGVCYSAAPTPAPSPAPSPTPAPAPKHTDAGRDYDKADGFSIIPPDGWKKTAVPKDVAMMYTAPEEKDRVTPNMNVAFEAGTSLDGVLPAVKKALAGALENYKAVDEGKVTVNGRPAVYLSGKFTVEGMKLQNIQYLVLGNNKKIYTVTLTTSEAGFAAARPAFEKCAKSLLTD
jgi:hypothetical protein